MLYSPRLFLGVLVGVQLLASANAAACPASCGATPGTCSAGGSIDRILVVDSAMGNFGDFTADITTCLSWQASEINDEFNQNMLQDELLLSQYALVVYAERGENAGGDITAATAAALNTYVQNGGNILVTGYDSIADGSDEDSDLVSLLGLTSSTDQAGTAAESPAFEVSSLDTWITNGRCGDARGTTFTGTFMDDLDQLVPATNTLVLADFPGQNVERLTVMTLPAASVDVTQAGVAGAQISSYGFWNGGEQGLVNNAQADWTNSPEARELVFNWIDGVMSMDGDGDGVNNGCDNCPAAANANQFDTDLDERGDECDNGPRVTDLGAASAFEGTTFALKSLLYTDDFGTTHRVEVEYVPAEGATVDTSNFALTGTDSLASGRALDPLPMLRFEDGTGAFVDVTVRIITVDPATYMGEGYTIVVPVKVFNVRPTVTRVDQTLDVDPETRFATLTGDFSDPGTRDTHTVEIQWGDGTSSTVATGGSSFSVGHTFPDSDQSEFTITGRLEDKDGGFDTFTSSASLGLCAVANFNSDLPDIDNDGFPDSCDTVNNCDSAVCPLGCNSLEGLTEEFCTGDEAGRCGTAGSVALAGLVGCSPDADGDGVGDVGDNCPPDTSNANFNPALTSNPTQTDGDLDGLGDQCDDSLDCAAPCAVGCTQTDGDVCTGPLATRCNAGFIPLGTSDDDVGCQLECAAACLGGCDPAGDNPANCLLGPGAGCDATLGFVAIPGADKGCEPLVTVSQEIGFSVEFPPGSTLSCVSLSAAELDSLRIAIANGLNAGNPAGTVQASDVDISNIRCEESAGRRLAAVGDAHRRLQFSFLAFLLSASTSTSTSTATGASGSNTNVNGLSVAGGTSSGSSGGALDIASDCTGNCATCTSTDRIDSCRTCVDGFVLFGGASGAVGDEAECVEPSRVLYGCTSGGSLVTINPTTYAVTPAGSLIDAGNSNSPMVCTGMARQPSTGRIYVTGESIPALFFLSPEYFVGELNPDTRVVTRVTLTGAARQYTGINFDCFGTMYLTTEPRGPAAATFSDPDALFTANPSTGDVSNTFTCLFTTSGVGEVLGSTGTTLFRFDGSMTYAAQEFAAGVIVGNNNCPFSTDSAYSSFASGNFGSQPVTAAVEDLDQEGTLLVATSGTLYRFSPNGFLPGTLTTLDAGFVDFSADPTAIVAGMAWNYPTESCFGQGVFAASVLEAPPVVTPITAAEIPQAVAEVPEAEEVEEDEGDQDNGEGQVGGATIGDTSAAPSGSSDTVASTGQSMASTLAAAGIGAAAMALVAVVAVVVWRKRSTAVTHNTTRIPDTNAALWSPAMSMSHSVRSSRSSRKSRKGKASKGSKKVSKSRSSKSKGKRSKRHSRS